MYYRAACKADHAIVSLCSLPNTEEVYILKAIQVTLL